MRMGTNSPKAQTSYRLARFRDLMRLSSEKGLALFKPWVAIYQGWVWTEQGRFEEGIAQMRHGMAAWQAMGTQFACPFHLALLAEAYLKAGQACPACPERSRGKRSRRAKSKGRSGAEHVGRGIGPGGASQW